MAQYQVVTAADRRQLSEFLIRKGQFLLPMVKLIEQSELAIDQMIDVLGRASIEAVLELSAQERGGPNRRASPRGTCVGTGGRKAWFTWPSGRCGWTSHGCGTDGKEKC